MRSPLFLLFTCEAYYKHGGSVDTEPTEVFKQWMEKHQYDPERGKDEPVMTTPGPTGTNGA